MSNLHVRAEPTRDRDSTNALTVIPPTLIDFASRGLRGHAADEERVVLACSSAFASSPASHIAHPERRTVNKQPSFTGLVSTLVD